MRRQTMILENEVQKSYQKSMKQLHVELGTIEGVRYFMLGSELYLDNGEGPVRVPVRRATSDAYVLDMDKVQ